MTLDVHPPLRPSAQGATLEGEARRRAGDTLRLTVARAGLFLLGLDILVASGVRVAVPLIIVWLPVALGHARRFEAGRLLVALSGAAVVTGLYLAFELASPARQVSTSGAVSTSLLYVSALLTLVFVMWSRSVLPVWQIGLWYGVPALAMGVLAAPGTINGWKFAMAWPATLVVLSLCERIGRKLVTMGALAALGLFSAANDYRSFLGFCALTIGLLLWQGRPRDPGHRAARAAATLGLLAATAGGAYLLGTSLLLSGSLGAENQQRTQMQIDQSGNLLAGGRPEWLATFRLMQDQPTGYGFGVQATADDVALAQEGVKPLAIPTADGYVANFMLGDGFRMHSVIADLWATQSLPGLAFGLLMVGILVRALVTSMIERRMTALAGWLILSTSWDLGFSPSFSALAHVVFAVALVIRPRTVGPRPGRRRLTEGTP